MQDDGGSHGVDLFLALAPVVLAPREQLVGFVACQPLILQGNRRSDLRREQLCELLHAPRLVVGRAVQPPGKANHDRIEPIFFCLQRPPVFGWSAVETRVALTYAAVWVIALAAWQAERPDLIRSPRLVLAHVWEGVE